VKRGFLLEGVRMTSGDEPQLGGQDHDNAPMISGRGTKIIVSARGAYVARNLPALIELMDAEQRLRFIQAAIRQALDVYEADIQYETRMYNPDLPQLITALHQWLAEPTSEHRQQVWRQQAVLHEHSRLGFGLQHLINAMTPDNSPTKLLYDLDGVVNENPSFTTRIYREALRHIIFEWRLQCAWAILQGKVIPPHPRADMAAVEAVISDSNL
jgi:hypothetical protein